MMGGQPNPFSGGFTYNREGVHGATLEVSKRCSRLREHRSAFESFCVLRPAERTELALRWVSVSGMASRPRSSR